MSENKRIEITVKGVNVRHPEIEYPFPVYQVTVESEGSVFGEEPCRTPGEAKALLRGLRIGLDLAGIVGVHIPGLPREEWITGRDEPVVEKGGSLPLARREEEGS